MKPPKEIFQYNTGCNDVCKECDCANCNALKAMEEVSKQGYTEGSNTAHKLLLDTLAKEFVILCQETPDRFLYYNLIKILNKYGYKKSKT